MGAQCAGGTGVTEPSRTSRTSPSSERNMINRKGNRHNTAVTEEGSPQAHIIDLLAAGVLSMSQTGLDRCVLCENLRLFTSSDESVTRTLAIPLYICASCCGGFVSEAQPKDLNSAFTTGWLSHFRKRTLAQKIRAHDVANYLIISSAHNHRTLYGNRGHHSASDCAICDEELKESNFFVVLPCRHGFHKRCISPWFEGDRRCPNCRTEIPCSFNISSSDELVNAYDENELKRKWDILCFYSASLEEVEDMHGCSYLSDDKDEDDAVLLGRVKSRSVTVCSDCHTDDFDMSPVVELGSIKTSNFGFSFGRQSAHIPVLEESTLDQTTMDISSDMVSRGSCRLSTSAIVYPSESEKSIDLSDIKFDDIHSSSVDDTYHDEVDIQSAIENLVSRKKLLAEKIFFMIGPKTYRIEKRVTKVPPSPAEFGGTFCTVTLDIPTHRCSITSRGTEYIIIMESA